GAEWLLALGDAHHRAGESEGARDALEQAAAIGRSIDEPRLIARAALVLGSLRAPASGSDTLLTVLLEESIARGDRLDDALRARVLASLGSHVAFVDAARHRTLASE